MTPEPPPTFLALCAIVESAEHASAVNIAADYALAVRFARGTEVYQRLRLFVVEGGANALYAGSQGVHDRAEVLAGQRGDPAHPHPHDAAILTYALALGDDTPLHAACAADHLAHVLRATTGLIWAREWVRDYDRVRVLRDLRIADDAIGRATAWRLAMNLSEFECGTARRLYDDARQVLDAMLRAGGVT